MRHLVYSSSFMNLHFKVLGISLWIEGVNAHIPGCQSLFDCDRFIIFDVILLLPTVLRAGTFQEDVEGGWVSSITVTITTLLTSIIPAATILLPFILA